MMERETQPREAEIAGPGIHTSRGDRRAKTRSHHCLAILLAAMFLPLLAASAYAGPGGAAISTSEVHWWFDSETVVGRSTLVRSATGLTAIVNTNHLPKGHVMTLWYIFYNHPENCSTTPCSDVENIFPLIDNLYDPEVGGDFNYGSGLVTGNGMRVVFGGHLQVNDIGPSGNAEFELEAVPLLNPRGAEVLLAIHSHGPKLEGADLSAQLHTYLGGCTDFLGTEGFATSHRDIPRQVGECSTIQYSLHLPGDD